MTDDRNSKKPQVNADKRILSGRKIARGIASEFMKATGGANVPILNGLVNIMFDWRKSLEAITMEKPTKMKMQNCFADMTKYDNAYAEEEHELQSLKLGFNQIISSLQQSKSVILAQYGANGFTQQVEIRIDRTLLNKLKIQQSSNGRIETIVFNRINNTVVERQLADGYNKAIVKAKEFERKIYQQIVKVNKAESDMNRNRKILEDICRGLAK